MVSAFKTYLWIVLLLAIVCSALLAHIGIPVIAIFGGMIASMISSRFIIKSRWNDSDLSETAKWSLSGLTALVGSQMGWVALLI